MSRDNARTPMQWDDSIHGGFSDATPWIEANPNFVTINVKENLKNEQSILNYYKKIISLRKKYPVIVYGDFKLHYANHRCLVYFERNWEDEQIIVLCNHSPRPLHFKPLHDLSLYDVILNNAKENDQSLLPYQAKVLLRRKQS